MAASLKLALLLEGKRKEKKPENEQQNEQKNEQQKREKGAKNGEKMQELVKRCKKCKNLVEKKRKLFLFGPKCFQPTNFWPL